MTTSTDPEDGTLVQREGVDAGSARSTAEGPLLTGGTTTGRPAGRPEQQADGATSGGDTGDSGAADQSAPLTQPAQVWATDSGVADPDAAYSTESGQDEGSID